MPQLLSGEIYALFSSPLSLSPVWKIGLRGGCEPTWYGKMAAPVAAAKASNSCSFSFRWWTRVK